MVSQNNQILSWGKKYSTNSSDFQDQITVHDFEHNIRQLVNQHNSTYILTDSGDVYQWPIFQHQFSSMNSFQFL